MPKAIDRVQHNPRAMLILLRAVGASPLPGVHTTGARVAALLEAAEYLKAVATRLRTDGVSRVMTSVRYGVRAAEAIVDAAHAEKADLIVMSDRRGGGRVIPGAVAEAVRHATRTPILFVRVDDVPVEMLPGSATVRPRETANA